MVIDTGVGLPHPQHGMGITIGDPNGDGCLDVAVTNNPKDFPHKTEFQRNNCNGTFSQTSGGAQNIGILDHDAIEWEIDFIDFDNDGDEDLAIVAGGAVGPIPAGGRNSLYQNDGTGVPPYMTDVTGCEGGVLCNTSGALGSAWADYDNDGDLDWFVANQDDGNRLYRNETTPMGNHLEVVLRGVTSDLFGVGAKVEAEVDG